MAESLEQRRNRLTRIRRQRIMDFAKEQYSRLYDARKDYLEKYATATEEEKQKMWDEYIRILNEGTMFRYGVAMADPNGKWMTRFNNIFNEVEKEKEQGKDCEQREESQY